MKQPIQAGLFGLGTVGCGVVELIQKNSDIIEKRIGRPVTLTKAVTAHPGKPRPVDVSRLSISDDPRHILDDPRIDVVLELMGGTDTAETVILSALKKGQSVITANKALLAEKAGAIFPAAYNAPGYFGFEASVGGAIPIIRTLREGFSGDAIQGINGIINGTANYILSGMTAQNLNFDAMLTSAQNLGYAEADPTFDIQGQDTAHKLIILMNLAFNGLFDYRSLHVEGITSITREDIQYADELGYVIKLLGKARRTANGIEGRVHPTLLKKSHFLAAIDGAYNAVHLEGDFAGPSVLHGLGAGAHPTASAVTADLVEACRFLTTGQEKPISPFSVIQEHLDPKPLLPMDAIESGYYLRFNVVDEPGVIADIARVLGDNGISIRSIIQKGEGHEQGQPVAVVFVTHTAREAAIQASLHAIDRMAFVFEKTRMIRMDL